jgi:hypothetical protein
LTIAAYSAVLFAFATLSTGDWAQLLVEYQVIVVAFAPMPVLMAVFTYWLGTGRLNKSEDPADSSADVWHNSTAEKPPYDSCHEFHEFTRRVIVYFDG